jgi:two-component system nitrate/nitrite response regulator NarL
LRHLRLFAMPLTILVVEDHAPFRRLICEELQREPEFQTIEAADGLEGVRKAAELQPDLILLDINLPKMSGLEVAKQIRRLVPEARLLFMSQESAPEIVRKALSLGADGYIHKLSAGTDLLPAIDAVLAGQRFVSPSVAFAELVHVPTPRRHEILFCSDDGEVVDGLARFIAAALNAGNAAMSLVTEPHRIQLLYKLRMQGVDVDGAIARGTCRWFDADVAPDPMRVLETINSVRAAAVRAGRAQPRIAFCGERAGCLWAAGRMAEAVQLEQFGNELPHDVDILCVYPVPYATDDQALALICAEHTAVSAC